MRSALSHLLPVTCVWPHLSALRSVPTRTARGGNLTSSLRGVLSIGPVAPQFTPAPGPVPLPPAFGDGVWLGHSRADALRVVCGPVGATGADWSVRAESENSARLRLSVHHDAITSVKGLDIPPPLEASSHH